MGKHRKLIIRLVSFTIAALLLFQVTSTSINCFDDNINGLQKTKLLLSAAVYHNDILNIGRESQKSPILKVQSRNTLLYVQKIYREVDSAIKYFYVIPLDNRKLIMQSIQIYFNGSKYK